MGSSKYVHIGQAAEFWDAFIGIKLYLMRTNPQLISYDANMNIQTDFQKMDARIARIEKSARRWRGVAIVMAVALGGGIAIGLTAPESKTITAEKFEVVNEEGVVVMVMESSNSGPVITQWDKNNQRRMIISTDIQGPVITQYSEKEQLRFMMRATSEEHQISQYDEYGRIKMFFKIDSDASVFGQLNDRGQTQMGMMVGELGPLFSQVDELGNLRLMIGTLDGNSPYIALLDEDEAWKVSVNVEGGESYIRLGGEGERLQMELKTSDFGPELVQYDADGEMRLQIRTDEFGPEIRELDENGDSIKPSP